MWKWQLVLSALATFTTAFAAPMPHVAVDVQKIDKVVEPVPRRFEFDAHQRQKGHSAERQRGNHHRDDEEDDPVPLPGRKSARSAEEAFHPFASSSVGGNIPSKAGAPRRESA